MNLTLAEMHCAEPDADNAMQLECVCMDYCDSGSHVLFDFQSQNGHAGAASGGLGEES